MTGPPERGKRREPLSRDEAVAKFVREHLAELSDAGASKEAVKVLRQRYFERLRLPPSSRFTSEEAAAHLAERIATAKRDTDRLEVIRLVQSIPFINEAMTKAQIEGVVDAARLGGGRLLSVDDLSNIGREPYLDRLESSFRNRAEAAAEEKLLEERRRLLETITVLGEKQEALGHAKSVLDSVPADANLDLLIDQEPGSQEARPDVLWWKELGLESDPFASNRGLSDIPETKYDDVVVLTPFVTGYVRRIETQPESFFGKTVVILGEFGSGKTTLFQLVGSKAATHGVLPIMTSLQPDVSVSRLTNQLVAQVQETLAQGFPHVGETTLPGNVESSDDIGRAIHALSELARAAPRIKGYLLLVDGLHKTETYLKQSLEFLSQLQTLQERFELRKLRIGVMVAGSPRWETELRSNPALSGSFYGIETIPPLSEDQAVEAVVRRIHSFTVPGAKAPAVVKAPLRTAYQVLVQRLLRQPTFRDYLDHVRDRFVARDYTTVGVSIKLHMETLRFVKEKVAGSPLGPSYKILLERTQRTGPLGDSIRRVLPEVCARKGIKEVDPFFEKNEGAFVLLMRQGWIEKKLDPTDRRPAWHLSGPVVQFLQELQTPPAKILPMDALEALFTEAKEIAPSETESTYGPIVRQMEDMVATWRPGLPETADLVERSLRKIREIDRKCKHADRSAPPDIREEATTSLSLLVQAIVLTATGKSPTTAESVPTFRDLWCVPENFENMLERTDKISTFDSRQPESFGLLLNHAQSLSDLCELLTGLVRGEGVSRLAGRELTGTEAAKLHTARTAFLAQRYQAALDKACEVVEASIRDVGFTAMRCRLGERALSLVPADIRPRLKEAPRGHARARRPLDRNFLFDVSRSEYAKILLSAEARRLVFNELVPEAEAPALRDQIALLFSLDDRNAHRDRPGYFRERATEIASALQAAPRICDLLNRVAQNLIEGSGFVLRRAVDGAEFCFSPGVGPAEYRSVSGAELDALVRDLLDRLESGELFLPPFEPPLLNVHSSPEIALGILRACKTQELVEVSHLPGQFGFSVAMTKKGIDRLGKIRALTLSKARESAAGLG